MEKAEKKDKRFTHKTVVTWDDKKKSFLSSFGNKRIEIAASPESKKHAGMWTPEELFIASMEGFLRDSFIGHAKRDNFEFLRYESKAEGAVETVDGKSRFSEIKIRPRIVVSSNGQIEKAKELISLAEKDCFISNFITAKITVNSEIRVGL